MNTLLYKMSGYMSVSIFYTLFSWNKIKKIIKKSLSTHENKLFCPVILCTCTNVGACVVFYFTIEQIKLHACKFCS